MTAPELLETALKLNPTERFALVDEILHSLDKPDPEIDRLWVEETQRRLLAYRKGEVTGIPAQEIFEGL